MKNIADLVLEQNLIAGLLKRPSDWLLINSFFSERDFFSEDDSKHSTILTILKQAIEKGEDIDAVVIAQRLDALGFDSGDDLSIGNYLQALSRRKVEDGTVLRCAKELKKLSIRRSLAETGRKLAEEMESLPRSKSYTEILEAADSTYNSQVNFYELEGDLPSDLYEKMEAIVEERGNNPITNFGMMGPFPTVNRIYGSLVRPGNITFIVARAKAGKSQLAMRYCTHLAANNDTVVLHLDNGEMSEEELIFRQCAALSGVPLHLLETGKWRQAGSEIVAKVRATWPKVKALKGKFFYYCVGGMSADEMINLTKRFYYNVVGRGREMVISFDYFKTTNQLQSGLNEWQVVGEMVDKFKKFIAKDVLFEGKPMISMFTSVQSNRSGIVTNRTSDTVADDESVVSLSDRIIQFCSHMFLLRRKTADELQSHGEGFGTHKLVNLAARHLGEDVAGALEKVPVGDTLKDNFINLEFKNFNIEDRGDLRDIVRAQSADVALTGDGREEDDTDF